MASIEPINAQTEQIELKRRTPDEHIKYLAGVVSGQIIRIAALESELAPIRALKVGSWQWAMVQFALNHHVMDRRLDKIDVTINSAGEPYTLLPESPPAPTADDFQSAIDDLVTYFENESNEVRGLSKRVNKLKEFAAAYRAANAKGGA